MAISGRRQFVQRYKMGQSLDRRNKLDFVP